MSMLPAAALSPAVATALRAAAEADDAWPYWARVCGADSAHLAYADWWRFASPMSAVE
jgi:hypothetical protein